MIFNLVTSFSRSLGIATTEFRSIISLYNNKINARVLIGQSAMVYCAGKPMEKSCAF